ncbi:MAG: [FeFe] hydrogenase H-cluster maturation GTPase HydF [Hominimerdicola sp.]
MSLNSTPSGDRVHIGIFGRRNAGKSSLINALTGQNLAIVSDILGTTTDPVSKAMELLPLGPVVIIDTPGLDDDGELGKLRIQKAYQALNKTDIALLVVDSSEGISSADEDILKIIKDKKIPYITVFNKLDKCGNPPQISDDEILVSAETGENIHELKERIARLVPESREEFPIIADKVENGDFVVLVVPIDDAAPKGRLILPQQQTIRELLECGATSIVCREHELAGTLANIGKKPKLVITDSQAFAKVSKETPADIKLTSFSILFARRKGNLATAVKGAKALDKLQDGDKILISEGCTHHRQCGDIGTVKLPNLIRKYTGKDFDFNFSSGTEFPSDLSGYKLIIHCGGCMLNEREMKYRIKCAEDADVPITNYGIAIAYMNGILQRSIEIFPEILS